MLLKCENLQRTGSFKIRGAYVRMSRLSSRGARRGRGRGVGRQPRPGRGAGRADARHQGDRVHARGRADPEGERDPGVRRRGASSTARTSTQALVAAQEFADETGAVLIHPFDHPDIVAGQGTVRARDPRAGARGPRPCWCRPAAAGCSRASRSAIKALRPDVRVVGVQAEPAPRPTRSRCAAAYPSPLESMTTMADGIAVGCPGDVPFAAIAGVRRRGRHRLRGVAVAGAAAAARAGQDGRRAGRRGRRGRDPGPAHGRSRRRWSRCSRAATSTRCCSAR